VLHAAHKCAVFDVKPHPLWELEFFKVNNYPILEQS
jgi:hypothetical protein